MTTNYVKTILKNALKKLFLSIHFFKLFCFRQNPKRVSSVSSRDHRHRHPHPHRRRNDPSRPPPPSQFSSPDAGEGPRLPHRNLPHPPDDENEALLLLWLLGEANRSPNNGMRFAVVGGVVVIVEIVRLVDETKATFGNQSSGAYPVVSASRRRG